MNCSRFNINVTQGCSFLYYLNATNYDYSPINLSGYSARGFVKNLYGDTGYLYNINPTPIAPFESGIIMISGAPTGTQVLPAGGFLYDVEIISNDNSYAIKILNGDFNVYPSTTF